MSEEEIKVLDLLAGAWNRFLNLPCQHPDDNAEFRTKIHDLQRIIMAREAVRNNPDYFTNIERNTVITSLPPDDYELSN